MWQRAAKSVLLVLVCMGAQASDRTFSMVGKNADDLNFIEVYAGCQEEARKYNDRCIQGGTREAAHFRDQNVALRSAIAKSPDGIALSVMNGGFLKENALSLPEAEDSILITFDSDFSPAYQHLREAHVGPDNQLIGRKLAQLLLSIIRS